MIRHPIESVGLTRGSAQMGILRFTLAIFAYEWLLLLVIGEIICRHLYLLFYLPVVNRADQVQPCIKSNFHTLPTMSQIVSDPM